MSKIGVSQTFAFVHASVPTYQYGFGAIAKTSKEIRVNDLATVSASLKYKMIAGKRYKSL